MHLQKLGTRASNYRCSFELVFMVLIESEIVLRDDSEGDMKSVLADKKLTLEQSVKSCAEI